MTTYLTPTKEEARWIRRFKRLARECPESIWLFSASGTLCVMRAGDSGERVMDGDNVDQSRILTSIDIDCDGGDF